MNEIELGQAKLGELKARAAMWTAIATAIDKLVEAFCEERKKDRERPRR